MGAAGHRGHIVVCGWNPTARDLIVELRSDEFDREVVVVHETDRTRRGTMRISCGVIRPMQMTSSERVSRRM